MIASPSPGVRLTPTPASGLAVPGRTGKGYELPAELFRDARYL
jgi:hypothetical protein